MSQATINIADGNGAVVLTEINNALLALISDNSGPAAPATTYAYMRWADTTTGWMKQRDAANATWILLYPLSALILSEWVPQLGAFTYIGGTQFSVTGDQTATYQIDRKVKAIVTAGTIYGVITASAFAAGITTVTVSWTSGALDAGLSAVSVGLLAANNQSIPRTLINPNIVGTVTNDNAAAGSIGEYVTSSLAQASAVSLVSTIPKTITSINLTAGDWDVTGVLDFLLGATTSINATVAGVNTVTNAFGGQDTSNSNQFTSVVLGAATINLIAPLTRYSLAAPATIYLVGQANFTVSTCSAFGTIRARRVR